MSEETISLRNELYCGMYFVDLRHDCDDGAGSGKLLEALFALYNSRNSVADLMSACRMNIRAESRRILLHLLVAHVMTLLMGRGFNRMRCR